MIGDCNNEAYDLSIIREALILLMFSSRSEVTKELYHAVMGLLNGSMVASELSPPDAAVDSERSADTHTVLGLKDIAVTEKLLWSVLTLDSINSTCAAPAKVPAGICLKLYRRIITKGNWKFSTDAGSSIPSLFGYNVDGNSNDRSKLSGQFKNEVEELFSVIYMISILCKAVVLAHTSLQKQRGIPQSTLTNGASPRLIADDVLNISYVELLNSLPPGTKSDTANSILESIKSCSNNWSCRFEKSLLVFLRDVSQLHIKNTIGATNGTDPIKELHLPHWKSFAEYSLREATMRYLLLVEPSTPGSVLFKKLGEKLPMPQSVKDFIDRLFTETK